MKRWESDFAKTKALFDKKLEELKTNFECVLN